MCGFEAFYVANTYVFSYLKELGILTLETLWKCGDVQVWKYGRGWEVILFSLTDNLSCAKASKKTLLTGRTICCSLLM